MILDGKELASIIKTQLKPKCSTFTAMFGRRPCLAVVLVGDNPSSIIYVKGKKKACEEIGIRHLDIVLPSDVSEESLLLKINELNSDSEVDGILVQLPLPEHISEKRIINSISPDKDVDGFTPENIGKLLLGDAQLAACTPKGILRLLDHYNISTEGKNVCVVGRSNIVGKPLAALLMQKDRNATVTVCNSYTPNLSHYVKDADIIISAAGSPGLITSAMVKDGAVVIDVGMNRISDSSKKSGYVLKGDVCFEEVSEKAGAITPVPGGVGPMTVAMLMENTLISACINKETEADRL